MDLLLFSILGLLLILQFIKNKIPRVSLTLIAIGLTAHNMVDYQFMIRMCKSEQESIAQMIQQSDQDQGLTLFRNAADNYFNAKENATADNPFNASFYNYLFQESMKR